MKKQQSKRVIPGFGLTMGVTLAMLSIVVLIPSCISGSIFGAAGISGIYPGDHTAESFVRILCKFYYRICGHGGECHHGTDPCVGAGKI